METTNDPIMTPGEQASVDQLKSDLEALVQRAESALHRGTSKFSDQVRRRWETTLERARETVGRLRERATEGARAADECVRSHPYQGIAAAVVVGLLIGLLIRRHD